MTNSKILKELIESKGLKMKYVAEYLSLSRYGFSKKLNNEQEFKTSEVYALCKLLGITNLEEKERIFFENKDD